MTQQPLVFPTGAQQRDRAVTTPHDVLTLLRHSTLPHVPPGRLIVLSGHVAIYRLGLCAAVDRALAGETVLYVAGANVFDPFLIGRLARASRVTDDGVQATGSSAEIVATA